MVANLIRAVCALLLLVVLPGCLVQTESFLTPREAAEVDERLIGVWTVPHKDDEVGFLFVRAAKEGGMDVLTMELRDDDENTHQRPRWDTSIAWPTEIQGLSYLNMIMDDGRLIVAYRINADGSAEFGFMNPEPFKKAVEKGALKGRFKDSFLGPEVWLTDDADNIAAFIGENGGHGLFVFGDPDKESDARLILVRHRLER